MRKTTWVVFCISFLLLFLGGCREISKDLFPEDESPKNTVVNEDLLTKQGKVNLYFTIQRDDGRRDENFGRFDTK